MPESFSDQDPQAQVRAQIGERVNQQIGLIEDAARIVGGPDATVQETFEQPPEIRDDAPMPAWDPEQTAGVLAIAHQLGYGAQETTHSGLTGGVALLEGGKVWKIDAEVTAASELSAHTLLFSGSPHVILDKPQLDYVKKRYGERLPEGTSEYEYAGFVARQTAGEAFAEPEILPFGYELQAGNPLNFEQTGQFQTVGVTNDGKIVQLMRIDREIYDEEGKSKYRHQPDPARRLGLVAEILTAKRNLLDPVEFVTSGTYAAKEVDTWRAGLQYDRPFGLTMYGRAAIVALQAHGANVPVEMPINQVPGELRSRYDKSLQLQAELQ